MIYVAGKWDSRIADRQIEWGYLIPEIYVELRRIAAHHLRNERMGHTLRPTDLVHETYLVLQRQHSLDLEDKKFVVSLASTIMRRVLVNYARARGRKKRGDGKAHVPLDGFESPFTLAGFDHDKFDIIALEDALDDLAKRDPDQVKIIDMHFFGGLTFEEIASVLGVSLSTVKRQWRFARAWLFNKLK